MPSVCLSCIFTSAPGSSWGHKNSMFDWYRVVMADSNCRGSAGREMAAGNLLTESPTLTRTDSHLLDLFPRALVPLKQAGIGKNYFGIRVVASVERTQ